MSHHLTLRKGIGMLCFVAASTTTASAGVPTLVSDHVWNDGQNSVIWGPGIWTRDGVVIGTTFPMGVVQPGGVQSHEWDTIILPVRPNDFHFDVEILFPTNPVTIQVWAEWTVGNPIDLWFEFTTFSPPMATDVDVLLDLSANTASVTDLFTGDTIYDGSADPFLGAAPLPPGFIPAGASTVFHIPSPGPVALLSIAAVSSSRRKR
ncbi:MAG: hypothetical protein RLN60_03225 [Phycisphaerales bacterium]